MIEAKIQLLIQFLRPFFFLIQFCCHRFFFIQFLPLERSDSILQFSIGHPRADNPRRADSPLRVNVNPKRVTLEGVALFHLFSNPGNAFLFPI